jgi:hypothetical protein
MRHLEDAHEINARRTSRVSPSVLVFETENRWTNFDLI